MKRLIRIIFLLVLIQYIITKTCQVEENKCNGEAMDENHLCVESGGVCKKMPICDKASETETDCKLYPVQEEEPKTHGCFTKEGETTSCEIKDLCETKTEVKDDAECRQYPVSFEKVTNHICVKKSAKDGCEEKLLCPTNENSLGSEKCSDFAVSDIKYACVENTEITKACKEVFLCEQAGSCCCCEVVSVVSESV